MNVYPPMDVTIVESPDGSSTPEPPLQSDWPDIDKLRWLAGVIRAREGITIVFNDAHAITTPERRWEWPELIGMKVGDTSTSVYAEDAWPALNNIELGARAQRLAAAPDMVPELVTALEQARSYKSLPVGMVWQDYYSPDDVLKIRGPLDSEVEKLRVVIESIRHTINTGLGKPLHHLVQDILAVIELAGIDQ